VEGRCGLQAPQRYLIAIGKGGCKKLGILVAAGALHAADADCGCCLSVVSSSGQGQHQGPANHSLTSQREIKKSYQGKRRIHKINTQGYNEFL
jgi:hypothetical protein